MPVAPDDKTFLTSPFTLTFASDPCELDVLDTVTVFSPSSFLLLASFPSPCSNEVYIKEETMEINQRQIVRKAEDNSNTCSVYQIA